MEKLRTTMGRYFDKLDKRWRLLPIYQQQQCMLYFFVGYLLLTVGVIVKVGYETLKPRNEIGIEPIENPVLKKNESPVKLQDAIINNSKKSD